MGRKSLGLLLLTGVLVVGYGCRPDEGEDQTTLEQRMPREVVVTVTGDTAPFTIDPDPVRTIRGDTISWTHPTADSLIIDLRGDPEGLPTADSLLSVARGVTASTTIRTTGVVFNYEYKYSVIVRSGTQRTSEDPHIIIEQ